MGLRMDHFIKIVSIETQTDTEGFISPTVRLLAETRAFREGRHGSEKWANRATFTEATELYRFRKIPNLTITTKHLIYEGDQHFEITSVEDVKGRGMYIEVLCKEVKPSGKHQNENA